MAIELTFKDVCDFVKKDGKPDAKLIDAVDSLLGLTMICAPVVLGPEASVLLPLLSVKNELTKIGKYVFDKFSKKTDDNYVAKLERMEAAYNLLCFTAFFEALDRGIPKALRDRIGLLKADRFYISKDAVKRTTECAAEVCETDTSKEPLNPIASLTLSFPHPTESLAQQIERHNALWKQMGDGFWQFVQKLAFWDKASDKDKETFRIAIANVPKEATTCFEAQYFELARTYPDFAVWSAVTEHKKTRAALGEVSEYVQHVADLANAGKASIDIGFARLHNAVLKIPETLSISQGAELVEGLARHYDARIKDPISGRDEPQRKGKPHFPLVHEAFIPQSFRVLRQLDEGKPLSLEKDETWSDLPRRSDLGAFLLSYLCSPYSTETPLMILGHPGSGKSLLTIVLSAQLMSRHYTAIRVPLREVNADAGIVAQIEQAIRRITNIGDPWTKLSSTFKNNPPLVILDGYDELLQASGKVFSGYLKDVQTFQRNESEQGRPVRVVVTSRVTLIDKATIPTGTTVVRLLEFDKRQRERWILIWNRANVNYFRDANVGPLSLPDENEAGADKLLALAEQPLLLLMLALYDSENNQLKKSKGIAGRSCTTAFCAVS